VAGTVVGGTGTDSVNIVAGTAATTSVSLGDGNDTITTDDDTFAAATTINGGVGTDNLVFTQAVAITDAKLAAKSAVEVFTFQAAGNTVDLSGANGNTFLDGNTGKALELANSTHTITALNTSHANIQNDTHKVTIGGTGAVTLTDAVNNRVYIKDAVNGTVTGQSGNDTITGGTGNDTINGGNGNNVIAAGGGADQITVGTGNESINGGDGNDTVTGFLDTNFDAADSVAGGVGTDVLVINDTGSNGVSFADALWANKATVETIQITGATSTNSLTFGTNANTMIGSLDAVSGVKTLTVDIVNGGATTIQAAGLTGTNHLAIGDSGDQLATFTLANSVNNAVYVAAGSRGAITGGDGNDTIGGGSLSDTLTGGTGNDRFDFYHNNSGGADHVTDFKVAGADVIRFSASTFTFNGAIPGVAFTASDITAVGADFVAGSFSVAQHFLYDTTDGQVWYDADGAGVGAAVHVLTIDNFAGYSFSVSDFAAIA